jgi:hypothetical protein
MANQSMVPNGAASRPVTTPAAIIQYAISDQYPWLSPMASRSNTTAIASSPSGKTINIW